RFSNTAFSVKEDAEIIKIVFYHTDFSSVLKSNKPVFFSRVPEIYRQVKAIYRLSLFKNNLPGTAEGMLLSLLNDIKNNINAAPS
ncbi:hypothetical protein, partial [Klebsiella pneumoniae]|uniref:hypothetical protein n=1 Tax=Klebsiella pneumoniae TaxID=573 RepID=UPI0025A276FB